MKRGESMCKHNELSERIKYEKVKLHIKYIIGMSIIISSITIILASYNNREFVNEISFASTITSIILSVIAIIMTIVGETKSENTKDKLINLSENLEDIVCKIENTTNEFENVMKSNKEMKTQLNYIGNTIEKKFTSVIPEVAVDINRKDEEKSNSFIFMIEQANKYLDYILYRDLCLTILYLDGKSKLKKDGIEYDEFIKDIDILKLNISKNNQVSVWNMAFIFTSAILNDEKFIEYIYETNGSKYSQEISIIRKLEKNLKEKNIEYKEAEINKI